MISVRIIDLCKCYRGYDAVRHLNLEIAEGEFFCLLGPSGCGKTTTLRCVAGFETLDSGDILFGDKSVVDLPPHRRHVGMVFQNYALFPHLSVYDNVAYGLEAQGVKSRDLPARVHKALDLVRMEEFERRYPAELSGGQQQRVALARALVVEPRVLLLDEPLSNLDARLRDSTRSEMRQLQRRLGLTALYVTHDQVEAMTLADRIGVMQNGVLCQVGSPEEIYRRPRTKFVALFLGDCNLFHGGIEHGYFVVDDILQFPLPGDRPYPTGATAAGFRPEEAHFHSPGERLPEDFITLGEGRVVTTNWTGALTEIHLSVEPHTFRGLQLGRDGRTPPRVGENLALSIHRDALLFFE
ncbi:ABC transporter ATP-binding protein [bacterium]|nr:ABC transporter ATP-binding protein [bacterium]